MGTPIYYVVLGALLAVLIITLIFLIRKRKHEEEQIRAYQEKMDKLRAERQAEEAKKQPNWRFWSEENQYSTYNEAEQKSKKWRHGKTYMDDDGYIPKYAAGDDMDSLRRNQNTNNKPNSYLTVFLIALSVISIIGTIISYIPSNLIPTNLQTNISQIFTKPTNTDKLNMQIVSTEPNQERTKVYVTLHYKNESINTCYNIVTTITLTYDDVTADTVEHTITTIPGGTETEEIITLNIPEEYKNAAYYVNAKTKYKWKIT